MIPEDLARLMKWSYGLLVLTALLLWLGWDRYHALGWLFGGVWSATNLLILKSLVAEICGLRRVSFLLVLVLVKLPVLYGAAAIVLHKVPMSLGAGLVGFHIPFLLILIEAVRRDRRRAVPAGVPPAGE
ncbi:MAG TPA: hypothetical protein PK360_03900 [bacterium]|nr:hypothetical protein [bacterium]